MAIIRHKKALHKSIILMLILLFLTTTAKYLKVLISFYRLNKVNLLLCGHKSFDNYTFL